MMVEAASEVLVDKSRKHLRLVTSDDETQETKNAQTSSAGGGSRGGGSRGGGPGGSDFRAGDNIVCEILSARAGGYLVRIEQQNLKAFLPTQALLRRGEKLNAQFVCVHNNQILLSARFSNNTSKLKSNLQTTEREENSDDLD